MEARIVLAGVLLTALAFPISANAQTNAGVATGAVAGAVVGGARGGVGAGGGGNNLLVNPGGTGNIGGTLNTGQNGQNSNPTLYTNPVPAGANGGTGTAPGSGKPQ
jgi:hypothetical protein